MSEPAAPELRLDGIEPLPAPPRGRGRALARDPFDDRALVIDLIPQPRRIRRPPRAPNRPRSARRAPAGPAPPQGLLERWLGDDVRRRLASLESRTRPDPFGLSPDAVRRALPLLLALYRVWFRVESRGVERVPEGPVVLAANHAGLFPFDGAMLSVDVWLGTTPPRVPRALFDPFVLRLGPVRRVFEAIGPVLAGRETLAALLAAGELVLVFPEGLEAIVKPVSQRYRLRAFHTGFVRAALAARAPIVPVAVVGSENQAPILWDVKPLAHWLGLPAAPVTPTFPWLGPLGLLPYPVPYRIVYGEPIDVCQRASPAAADDETLVREVAADVRRTLQRLVDRSR